MAATLRLATRSSPLARAQAELVAQRLRQVVPALEVEFVVLESAGDQQQDVPIASLGEKGAFTTAIERAVIDGRADVAVHSAKDLPSSHLPEGLVLAGVPIRADVRDVLVGGSLDSLPQGATVATGSVRRRAQLAHVRPDLVFLELRGNIATRLSKVPEHGAVVIALAALTRLGLENHAIHVLDTSVMLPQVGQGALALRCRDDDEDSIEFVRAIDDANLHRAVRAERAFLARLGGGCDAPVGALARSNADGTVEIEALIASVDGQMIARDHRSGTDPEVLGRSIAEALLSTEVGSGLNSEEPSL